MQLQKVEAENARLRERLMAHGIPVEEETERTQVDKGEKENETGTRTVQPQTSCCRIAPSKVQLSLGKKVSLFMSLFRGREDVFAHRWTSKGNGRSGYQPVCKNEWVRGLCDKQAVKYKCGDCPNRVFAPLTNNDIYKHLEGKAEDERDVIGVYAILDDDTCRFLCADFDDKNCEHGYQDDVRAYVSVCKEWHVPAVVERSRSGKGAHVWILFDEKVSAAKARKMGNAIMTEAMDRNSRISFKSYDRFFPNQDKMPEGGFGNLVALPLQGKARRNGNSVFVDEDFVPYPDQWEYLSLAKKMTEAEMDRLLSLHGEKAEVEELSLSSESKPWDLPICTPINRQDLPKEIVIVQANMLYIPTRGMPSRVLSHMRRMASFRNPEFYSAQAGRRSTYNIPRIISCAEMTDEYLMLPRGCKQGIEDLLNGLGVAFCFEDKSVQGHPIEVSLNIELYEEQQEALAHLMQYDNGILAATTAFGKTITALGLIAARKVNTLILVHTQALLDQWKEKLEANVTIQFEQPEEEHKRGRRKKFSPFGTLSSSGISLHGQIDVAIMQSCLTDDGELKPFLNDYGMVICDECHHTASVTFEQVLKNVHARYVYGLTATPMRRDGHQPIFFMQYGPIRFKVEAKSQIERQTFERFLIPRFTTVRHLSDEELKYGQVERILTEDESRNALIIADVQKALADNRTPIILTKFTTHVETLANLLAPHCPNVITLVGSKKEKEKREMMERLHAIPAEESLVIVATGKYVGEGFDYARLDTLFIASPISWEGVLQQYAGRLHRNYETKQDVRIYDYVDVYFPVCNSMYHKRLKGYASIGYRVMSPSSPTGIQDLFGFVHPEENPQREQDVIFNGTNFHKAISADIAQVRKSIVISCPRLWIGKRTNMLDVLAELQHQGIEVMIFTRKESDHTTLLAQYGLTVRFIPSLTLSCVLIDSEVVWYGNANPLAYNTEEESVIKLRDKEVAGGLIDVLSPSILGLTVMDEPAAY